MKNNKNELKHILLNFIKAFKNNFSIFKINFICEKKLILSNKFPSLNNNLYSYYK